MSDIFLSYAKEDREQARVLAAALEGLGWSVFWDRTIPPGLTWRAYIGEALEAARCLVVAWSATSVESEWVLEEADRGKQRGILIPVLFEAVEPPLGFRAFQALDLAAWDGRPDAPALRNLAAGMDRLLGPPPGRETPARSSTEAQRTAGEERRRAGAETEERPAEAPSRGPATFLRYWPRAVLAVLLLVALSLWVKWSWDGTGPARNVTQQDEILGTIESGGVGIFRLGESVRLPLSSDNYIISESTDLRVTEEGESAEPILIVSSDGQEVLRIRSHGVNRTIKQITVVSSRYKTEKNIGVGSTLQDFLSAYPDYRLWWTYVSGMYVVESASLKAQFLLREQDYIGGEIEFTSEVTDLELSDFREDAKILKIRIF